MTCDELRKVKNQCAETQQTEPGSFINKARRRFCDWKHKTSVFLFIRVSHLVLTLSEKLKGFFIPPSKLVVNQKAEERGTQRGYAEGMEF